ncbi:cell envelope biogenesis protein OmpA [Persicimonas caeni]|uniref:Cell envelope biogenesis protein OmpA n=1 Tax=Persicimonas caeni TaxID=2292766 RepID=A0A4Y6Q0V3_PERCE|nr:OmpA family protein [Persicimonas caeni]QDG53625.1 cell envelope biogenesis protein OmpA [Persicimonas caeni]QED34846.1 OmpA family protein [Persicimonas caeni]
MNTTLHHLRRTTLLASLLVALLWPMTSNAQTPASETFEPQAVGATSIWSVATSRVAPHLLPSVELVAHYADDPIELQRRSDSTPITQLVDEQYKLDVGLGVGFFDRVEVGLVLPVVLYQSGNAAAGLPAPNTIDLAEARGQVRFHLLDEQGLGLGAQLTGYLPTSDDAPYQSNGSAGALGSLIADYRSDGAYPWRVAANVGWALQSQTSNALLSTDDRLDVRLGAEATVVPDTVTLLLSGFGRWEALADPTRSVSAGYLGGARVRWGATGLSSTFGAGGSLSGGYGSPDVRVVASVGYAPSNGGSLGLSASSSADGCAGLPEDFDGFQDDDGCADPDNDADGVPDTRDNCPNVPEDVDGFEDADGCPDSDNDADGIADFNDACPDTPGTEKTSGCPFVDEDGDGIDASVDRCPNEAEDADGFEDNDGCPDADNDRDGIADADDACPDVPESVNGVDDTDGCPDEGDSAVRLSGDRIEILERVHFDTARATIKSRSHSVLEQVASVMKANADIRLLRVQGHTDSRGDEQDNLELSQQRAVSVKEFLIEQGVDAERLSARGYGESHPIADNDTADGRADNRRVEFHIIERVRADEGERGDP